MPFETATPSRRRIAIVGAGISGMAAAYQLAADHAVVLFEAEGRLGGHARTKIAGKRGDQPVDTGFIVFNHVNYPNLLAMFEALDVPTVESNMSFGASIGGGRLEYALASLDAVFAQRRNLMSPAYLRMLRDILHFNKNAYRVATANPGLTIGDLLARLGTGPYFRDYYITPLSGAIWSTPTRGILDFPADAMMRFFQNHALLQATGQHQWHTVKGGSVAYVSRLQDHLLRQGVEIRTGAAVAAVRRDAGGVMLRAHGAEWEMFDDVILATHSDDTLAMLEDASPEERAALGAVRYQSNEAILHADPKVMPQRRKCWASWVYVEPTHARPEKIDLTYWMNSLQPIPQDDPMFVTLNSNAPIREDLIYDVTTFRHPVYDTAAIAAQGAIRAMNGTRNTWFCGAWMKSGFHEDGFASAVDVAQRLLARDAKGAADVDAAARA